MNEHIVAPSKLLNEHIVAPRILGRFMENEVPIYLWNFALSPTDVVW